MAGCIFKGKASYNLLIITLGISFLSYFFENQFKMDFRTFAQAEKVKGIEFKGWERNNLTILTRSFVPLLRWIIVQSRFLRDY